MTQTNYQAGVYYEYSERDLWRSRSYYSERQYGSYGPFDVYAIAPDGSEIILIEVKSFKRRKGDYRKALSRIRKIPTGPGVRVLLALYGPRVSGKKTPRKVLYDSKKLKRAS